MIAGLEAWHELNGSNTEPTIKGTLGLIAFACSLARPMLISRAYIGVNVKRC